MAGAFFIIYFCRNLVFKDYRTDEISLLKASGLTEDEIGQYVPKTSAEKMKLRRQDITKYTSEYAQLMMDVATLKEQVKVLNDKMGIGGSEVKVAALPEVDSGSGGVGVGGSIEAVTADREMDDEMEVVEGLEEPTHKEGAAIDSMERVSMG